MQYETELTIGQFDQAVLTVLIDYTFDGDDIIIEDVFTTKWSGSSGDLDRDELEAVGGDGSWAGVIDKEAKRVCEELVESQDWLYQHIDHFDKGDDREEDKECDNFGEGVSCECPACKRLQAILERDFEVYE